jgi:hypothetical protein
MLLGLVLLSGVVVAAPPTPLVQEPNTWVKRSPLKDGPASPGMGTARAHGCGKGLARSLQSNGGAA